MKQVVILGATSAIAQQVARLLAADGVEMLLVGRSLERLELLRSDLQARGAAQVWLLVTDLVDAADPRSILMSARTKLPEFDTVLIAHGTLLEQEQTQIDPALARREIENNFTSVVALATAFAGHFEQRGGGTLAVISSVAGDRGRKSNYVYGAAKAGVSVFLEGLAARVHASGVRVLDIKPGPVDTPMTVSLKKSALFATPQRVAADIYGALKSNKSGVVYTPWFWRWVMRAVRAVPTPLMRKLNF
jgi:short-subunit dehydrogenase